MSDNSCLSCRRRKSEYACIAYLCRETSWVASFPPPQERALQELVFTFGCDNENDHTMMVVVHRQLKVSTTRTSTTEFMIFSREIVACRHLL